jgi:hypothetical protein
MTDEKKANIPADIQKMQANYEKDIKRQALFEENKDMEQELKNERLKDQVQRKNKMQALRKNVEDEDFFSRGFDESKMRKDIEDRKNAVTFINKGISEHYIAAPGSLIVIPSMTNNGKSTLTAQIAETLVSEGKKVLILSNEESEEDCRARVSCLRTFVSFGDYKTSKCSDEQYNKVIQDVKYLVEEQLFVVIAPKTEEDAYKVNTVEGVMAMLEKANGVFDAVIVDYYTNVNKTEKGQVDPWHVNNEFATQLNTFKNTATYPIILTAQCNSVPSKKGETTHADMEAVHPAYRWKGGTNILTYATDIIELKREYDKSHSLLFAHKVRFAHGTLNRGQTLWFDKDMQRFIEKWTSEFAAKVTADRTERSEERDAQYQSLLGE